MSTHRVALTMVILNTHPEHVATNPENAIIFETMEGMVVISIYKPPDMHTILKAYESKHILLDNSEKHVSPLPLTYLEAKHCKAQNFYREEQKYIRKHKGKFDALIEADCQAQANALSGPLWASVAAMARQRWPPATYSG
ncbi:hypothetical protein EDB86DRAFT_2832363 [Lactarius hatsudake]|nr:hypothetical protein EDB86DRAFT_2832363 [Lactarius hatsudake]